MRYFSALFTVLLAPGLIFAGLELGSDFSYFNPRLNAPVYPGLTTAQTTSFNGPLFTGYGHLTFGLPQVILFGFGPSLAFSNQIASDETTASTREDATISRLSLDGKMQIELLPYISPYVRLNIGKDWINWTDRGTAGSNAFIASSSAGGFFYTAMLGIQIPFSAEFALYLQGGYTASPGSTIKTRSYAVGGVNQPLYSANIPEVNYSGFILGVGGRLSF